MADCMEVRKRIEEMEKIFNMNLEMNKSLAVRVIHLTQAQSSSFRFLDS